MNTRKYFVYILTNYKRTTLYIGVTNSIEYRIWQHKNKINEGFTAKYNLKYLVYYEQYKYIPDAIYREKQLKKWNRTWKEKLINSMNPKWEDLSKEWCI